MTVTLLHVWCTRTVINFTAVRYFSLQICLFIFQPQSIV